MIDINKILKLNYDYLEHKYGSKSILGIFATGLINYGYAEENDNNPYNLIAIYLPTFDELCVKRPEIATIGPITLIDIRNFYRATKNFDFNSIEILFTDGCNFINPLYEKIFNDNFIDKREKIAHYNDYERILRAKKMSYEYYENNDKFNSYRLLLAAKKFSTGDKCKDCFRFDDDTLWEVKKGKTFDKNILNEFDTILNNYTGVENNDETDFLIRKGIINIMMFSLSEKVDFDTFFDNLTDKEKQAYNHIENELGHTKYGNIVVLDLIKKYGLSRPTYSTVLRKMEKDGIAEINNMGVKGIYVKIL